MKCVHSSVQIDAGWSSLAARRAHNPKVAGSNPAPATNFQSNVIFRPQNSTLIDNIPINQSTGSHALIIEFMNAPLLYFI